MSSIEHHATVEKGLKMKIKRKNVAVDKSEKNSKKDQNKTESWKNDTKLQGESSQSANGMLADKASKLSLFGDKEKSPKSKQTLTKKDKGKGSVKGDSLNSGSNLNQNGLDSVFGQTSMEPKLGETAAGKRECIPDPYEFNAKVEDGISSAMPMKKMKIEKEKVDQPSSSASTTQAIAHSSQDATTNTQDVAVVTEPDCLGPCEPGTQVNLEGIVWHESDTGVLVVNVTWRGKTYVGTLLDATRHDWAPPRFNCDSPSVEFESRTPKGRGKRRGASNTPVNDTRTLRKGRRGSNAVQTFTAPPSPAKSDVSTGGLKRKGRPQDIDLSAAEQRSSKRSRSGSQAPTPNLDTPPTDAQGYIECPEPNCNKKYRHANGLKYHQSHAHSNSSSSASFEDAKEMDIEDIPLSVMKNSAKKEKDIKKESNTSNKDSDKETKDSNQSSDQSKSDNSSVTKKDDEEHDKDNNESDTKDSSSPSSTKSDSNCDNSTKTPTPSKKGENNVSGASCKVPVTQCMPKSSNISKPTVSQNNSPKSSVNNNLPIPKSSSSPGSVNSSVTVSIQPSQTSSLPSSTLSQSASATSTQSETCKSDTTKLVDIKPKISTEVRVTKPNRPIVPAPAPQVLSSVQVTHSNLSPVMSHAQMSPQLKAIQPKPTIMGEPQNLNPALADFNKDRKKVQKKKPKDSAPNSGNRADQPTIKIERTGVIKTNPLPNNKQSDQSKKDNSGAKDGSRAQSESQRSQSLSSRPHKGVDMSHSRMNQNPNLLKVGSPLQVSTPENHKTPVSDDVQSPAYSDISDANESASPAAPSESSPQKQKEETANKKEEKAESSPPQQQQPDNQMVSHYGVYSSYYGQSPYGINNMSPGQKSNSSSTSGSGNTPSQAANQSKEQPPKSAGNEEKKPSSDEQNKSEKKPEEKEGTRPKLAPHPPGGSNGPPPNLNPHQMHEWQMQQNWYQQMYIQSLPRHVQYQYMANGWYPQVDPAYMQQMMEEQRRAQVEQGRNEREGGTGPEGQRQGHGPGSGPELNRGPDSKGSSGPSRKEDNATVPKQSLTSPGQGGRSERNDNNNKAIDEKNQALREKQNETHQILKENIDIKNEMDKQMNRQEYERFRQAEEMRRYKMYQEQKMIEERKKMELTRKGDGRPENLTSKAPGTKPIEHNPRSLMPGQRQGEDRDNTVSIKRESGVVPESKMKDSGDSRDAHSRESSVGKYQDSAKSSEEKSKTSSTEKHRSETPHRNPETPKHRPGGCSSKSGSPSTSINSSVPGSPSYSPYVSYPYMQNPQYIGMEPSHPLYRNQHINPVHISGYPGSGYIHPSQMGYRQGVEDEKEKLSAQKSIPPTNDSDVKKGDLSNRGSGPYYGNMHKIHELSEKGRPRSRNSSPGLIKSGSDTGPATSLHEKHRDFTNSPPTQRHVHTHHHTHVLQPGIQPTPVLQAPGFSPVYDPYSAMFVSQAQSPHQYPPK